MTLFKKIIPFLFILLLSFFVILPILRNGFFSMHDDTQVARIYEMAKSLKMGMFPVRWVPDLGYGLGYPIFNFYAPASYYFGAVFVLLGADALLATKITMIFAMCLSGFLMYLFAKQVFGKSAGVVAAVFYVYAPYHALDLYVRGDLSEIFAYAFIPLVFYGLLKVFRERKFYATIITALSYFVIIISHNLTAFMITPFLIVSVILTAFIFNKDKQLRTAVYLFMPLILGLVLSFFYWFPALFELNKTNVSSIIGGGSYYPDHFVCLSQLWSSPWGFGGSAKGCVDGLSFMIGKLHIIVSFVAAAIALFLFVNKKYKRYWNKSIIVLFLFAGFIISCFLTLEASSFIWKLITPMSYLQFPWRFLLMASFFSALLSAGFIYLLSQTPFKKIFPHFTIELSAILIITLLFLNIKYFVPQKILDVNSDFYTNDYALKWTVSKISDEYLPKGINKPKNAKEALLNKRKFDFSQTPIENLSNVVSIAGIFILVIGIIKFKEKHA